MTPRRAVQVGDIFSVQAASAPGVLGRVVSTSAIVGPVHGCHLVYLYRPGAGLGRDALLGAPLLASRAPWSRRYFVFERSEPILPGDCFERHCFRDARGACYDEESRPVDRPFEPIGEWRLHEDVVSIEAAVAAALRGGGGRP